MAAFALGLIGDGSSEAALAPLLTDASARVRGRAAEALGLIGAKGAAPAIGQMVAEYAASAPVAAMQPDDESAALPPEAEAFKLGLFALVRLKAYDPLAAAVLAKGQPVTAWWPVAYALQRVEDPRAAPALLHLLGSNGRYTRAFAARGLGTLKDASAVKPLLALLDPSAKAGLELTVAAIRALAALDATDAAAPIARLAGAPTTHPNIRLEAVAALGALRAVEGLPSVPGPPDRRVARYARRRAARRRGHRSGELYCRYWRAWNPIVTGGFARRSPRRSARSPRIWQPIACGRCSRTRTSAWLRRCCLRSRA